MYNVCKKVIEADFEDGPRGRIGANLKSFRHAEPRLPYSLLNADY